jgi:predicted kinase
VPDVTGDVRTGPVLYLLAGLPGSGKSTCARRLEAGGAVRVSVDELLRRRYGQAGVDYPLSDHLGRVDSCLEEVRAELARLLAAGRSVVLDHGLGRRAERESFKRLAEEQGARWRLLLLRASRDALVRRLAERPEDDGGPMDADLLDRIAAASEEPAGEGEEVIHTGGTG